MKYLYFLFVCLISFTQASAQWNNITSPVPGIVHGICFPDSLTGYISDIQGNISKTTDGGFNWMPYQNITSLQTRYPYFFDAQNVMIPASSGRIYRTTDGGTSWNYVQLNTNVLLYKISFSSILTGYVIGDGYVAKTTDGGSTWLNLQCPTFEDLRAVCFINENIGWIGGTNVLYKTTDGGTTWSRSPAISSGSVRDIVFLSESIGYLTGDLGIIFKTTNQGSSWFPLQSSTTQTLYIIKFLTPERAYAVGNYGTIIATTNGGNTWIHQNSGTSQHLEVVGFRNNLVGFSGGGAIGSGKVLLRTFNGGFPVPALNLTIPHGGETWLAGSIHHITWNSQMVDYLNLDYTTDNGNSWISIATNLPGTLSSYSWIVPLTPSNQCRVRIVDALHPGLRDSSASDFLINSVSVTSPNGGESWQVLTNKNITWLSTNINAVNIEFSSNNGTNWTNVVMGYNNSGTYAWTVPNLTSNQCRIRISDSENSWNYDVSNSGFSITPENILARITADTLYWDNDFNGEEIKQISGSTSIGNNITYAWLINETPYTGVSPIVIFRTGLNKIKLTVTGLSGANSTDSMYCNVIASRNITEGSILSGVSEFQNHYYTTSADKAVYEIDSLGRKLKTFMTGGQIQSVLTISQSGRLFTGSTDTRLYSFDMALIPIWDKATGGVIKSAPALSYDGNTVYVVTNSGNLIAYDVSSGNYKWGYQTEGIVTSSPVVLLDQNNDNIVYAGTSSGYLYAVKDNGSSAELFWRKQLADTLFSSIAVYPNGANSMIFTGSKGGYLYRIMWDGTYDESWKINLNSPIYSSPVIDENNLIYIGTSNGKLYAYTLDFSSSSSPLFWYAVESGITGTPAIGSNGMIYFGTQNGFLYSLTKSDTALELHWKSNLYSSINSSALISETGLVYAGTNKGDVYVLKEYLQSYGKRDAVWPTYKGNNQRSKVVSLNITGNSEKDLVISDYNLLQCYPNPFNPSTTIEYQLPCESQVQIQIYSVTGEKVTTLVNTVQGAGSYRVRLETSKYGMSSGIYFYRMVGTSLDGHSNFISTKKMIILK